MSVRQAPDRITLERHLRPEDAHAQLRRDVMVGLTSTPKWLPPKWFYDAEGSELFEQITRLPEYYPTRRERELLQRHADRIAAAAGADTLVELGSGSSEKTRLLLDALQTDGSLRRFVPFDVSDTALVAASLGIAGEYPGIEVHAVLGDFERHLGFLPVGGRRLVAFLGGTIGNFEPAPRAAFLAELAAGLGAGDTLLLGTDLVKDPGRLVRAYDDATGVTARFNLNVLQVLNRELGADADPGSFEHVAIWDAEREWIEMRLRSTREQVVHVRDLGLQVPFAAGEEMRTEISAKFTRERLSAEYAAAGLELRHWWSDPAGDYALSMAVSHNRSTA